MVLSRLSGFPWRLPSRCRVCHGWPSQAVCEACVTTFGQPRARCVTCALPVPDGVLRCGACLRTPPPMDAVVAAVDYGYPWSALIRRFKFHADAGLAATLARVMASAPWAEPALEAAHRVLPIPLSRHRLRERGYNQAWLLARALAPRKADAGLLLRWRDTPAQSTLGREERLRSLEGAFALEPTRSIVWRDQRVVLVDDVMTSGATLHCAAAVLRRAGAAHVTALVLARTPAQSDSP